MRPSTLLALAPLALTLAGAAPSPAPKSHAVACWPVANGAWLELRSYARGTPAPLELRVEHSTRKDAQACREHGDTARRAPLVLPVAGPLRVDWRAVRDWRAVATARWGADSTQVVDTVTTTAALAGEGGELALVPRPPRYGVPDSMSLRLSTGGRTSEFVLSIPQAWNLVWALGEQANVHDPEGRVDYVGVLRPEQVEEPARYLANPDCQARMRRRLYELPVDERMRAGRVVVHLVIGTTGVPEAESIQLLDTQAPPRVQEFARDVARCTHFRPARLRGRAVRMALRQELGFW